MPEGLGCLKVGFSKFFKPQVLFVTIFVTRIGGKGKERTGKAVRKQAAIMSCW